MPASFPPPVLIREALLDVLALVLPVECAGCGLPDRALCGLCRARLAPAPLHRGLAGVGAVAAGAPYDGVARRVLLAAKEHERLDVLGSLAPLLAAAVAGAAERLDDRGSVELCPVPASRRAYRRRGVDPVRVLIGRSGLRAGRLLIDRGGGAAQKSLRRSERVSNAHGRLRARRRLDGRRLLLVDDVITTGATLAEAARAVREAGGEVVGAAVALSTPLRAES